MHLLEPRAASDPTTGLVGAKIVNGTRVELIVWIVLVIWPSHFGLPLLVGTTLFSKNIHRLPAFVNMCVIWILAGIFSSLLVYSGHTTGPEPPKALCLAQAALLHGIYPAVSLATFFLVYQLFASLRRALLHHDADAVNLVYTFIMLILPYLALVVFAIVTIKVGADHPELASRRQLFFTCNVHFHTLSSVILLFVCAFLIGTLILEAWTAFILFRHGKRLQAGSVDLGASIDYPFVVRVVVFTAYLLLGACLGFIGTFASTNAAQQMILPTIPWIIFFLFGMQRAYLRVWAFWRREAVPSRPAK